MNRFQDKVAIVTGADSGIGLATAKRLGAEGARLVLVARNAERLASALEAVKAAGAPDAMISVGDVADERGAATTVEHVAGRFGGFDVLVNNAGALTTEPLIKLKKGDWQKVLDVDLLGAFYFARQALLHAHEGGAVVNVSSIHAFATSSGIGPYAAAKAGLASLSRTISIEGRERRIRANTVLPGAIETPFLHTNPNVDSGNEKFEPDELGTVDNVAAAIAFLAADESCFIRGATLVVDGGRTIKI